MRQRDIGRGLGEGNLADCSFETTVLCISECNKYKTKIQFLMYIVCIKKNTITWDLKIWKWQLSLKIYAMVKFKDPVSIGIVCYLKENAMTGLLKYVLKVQSNVPVL